MGRLPGCLSVMLAWAVAGAASLAAQGPSVPPCTVGKAECTEWVTVAAAPESRVLLYRTHPLDSRNERITRALIVVHGGARNANDYFNSALAASFLAGALDDTLVVAPRFASHTGEPQNRGGTRCLDTLAANEASWPCSDQKADTWRTGAAAVGNGKLTSFAVVDEVLSKIARRDTYPNLRRIVVAGHSGGGTFTLRYAMANKVHDGLGVPVSYVASNQGVIYLDDLRPTSAAYPPTAAAPGYTPLPPAEAFIQFGDGRNCSGFNAWPYGLKGRVGYTAELSDEQLKKQLTERPVTYLLGGLDILPLAGFDDSCSAMAAGPTRLARGLAFARYVNEKQGARHTAVVIPLCGHNERCIFTSPLALPVLFPKVD